MFAGLVVEAEVFNPNFADARLHPVEHDEPVFVGIKNRFITLDARRYVGGVSKVVE